MYIFSSESEKIDWAKEPDVNEFRRLFNLSKVDPQSAVAGFEKLASNDSVASMIYLASGYMRGIPEKSRGNAKHWYSLAASKGHHGACMVYGRLCVDDKEYGPAEIAFEKVAQSGDPTALYMLGKMRLKRIGDDSRIEQGVTLLKQSSDLGFSFATRDLVILMLSGKLGFTGLLNGIALLPRSVIQMLRLFNSKTQE
jgi:TPR repeat protein